LIGIYYCVLNGRKEDKERKYNLLMVYFVFQVGDYPERDPFDEEEI
jgi:hypothetical protein